MQSLKAMHLMLSNIAKWWINQVGWVREECLGSLRCILNRNSQESRPKLAKHLLWSPNEIELLGLRGSPLCTDRTRLLWWPDASTSAPASVAQMLPRVPASNLRRPIPTVIWLSPNGQVMTERTETGPDVAPPHPLTPRLGHHARNLTTTA
jgi:hypothetical protein